MRMSGLLLLVLCTNSFGQTRLPDLYWQNVMNLPVGTDVAIKTKQEKYQGCLQQVDLDSLVLLSSERANPGRRLITRKLMKDQILEVRLNKRFLSTIVGGGIGAGIGVSIGAIAGSRVKNNEMNGVVETTLGFVGGLLGSLVGHNVPFIKGKKIYSAP